MSVAFLFPGQGVGVPWSAPSFAERLPQARALLDVAAAETGCDLAGALRRASPELSQTRVLQPLMVAVSLGIHAALVAGGLRPRFVAGHSLGEIAAWAAADHVAPEDAVRVAALRGRLMGEAAARAPGTMLSIADADEERLGAVLAEARAAGAASVAAHNAPREWAVTGERAVLLAVARVLPSAWIDVDGAWHSPAMEPVRAPYLEALRAARAAAGGRTATAALVCNRTGQIVEGAELLLDLFAEQLTHPIRWAETMTTLAAAGVTDFVTVGPGRVLRALVRKNLGGACRVHSTEHVAQIGRTLEDLVA